jgi:TrmH family RNA methyltransferase
VITSIQNPRVQAARKLRRRSERDEAAAFLAEGRLVVIEALRSDLAVREVFVGESYEHAAEIETEARAAGTEVIAVGDRILSSLSDAATPQGVVAVVESPAPAALSDPGTLALVLDQVRDPGNAGTLVRSGVAAGAEPIVFAHGSVDPYNPKVVRSSAGALFKARLSTGVETSDAVEALSSKGSRILGAEAGATPCDLVDLTGPFALILGNEAWGFSPEHSGLADELISIPMPGPVGSLNVAVAGSILLFEAVRQRRAAERLSSGSDG